MKKAAKTAALIAKTAQVPMLMPALVTLLAAGSGTALAQGSAADPTTSWQAVIACTGHRDAADRHDCIDQVLRQAGVLDPVREVQVQREDFGRATRPVAPPPAVEAATPATRPTAPPSRQIDSIATTVAAARIGADGKLLVATAEASVWRQVDGETFRVTPPSGTGFEVERGSLGSFSCKVGRSSYRCTRVD